MMHGAITPLWAPTTPDYDAFAEHLARAGELPTWLPWPLGAGAAVTDFGSVGGASGPSRAAFASCTHPSEADGLVEITVVSEEPGVGLGDAEVGHHIGHGAAVARLRIGGQRIPLWAVPTSDLDPTLDRSVFAGEAGGRWLWLILRPASAALLLLDEWSLENVAAMGPSLLDLPFRGSPRGW
jgi:hypothetical protein